MGRGADHGFAVFGRFSGSNRSGTAAGKQRAAAGAGPFDFANESEYLEPAGDDRARATCAQHDDAAADIDYNDDPDDDGSKSEPVWKLGSGVNCCAARATGAAQFGNWIGRALRTSCADQTACLGDAIGAGPGQWPAAWRGPGSGRQQSGAGTDSHERPGRLRFSR